MIVADDPVVLVTERHKFFIFVMGIPFVQVGQIYPGSI